MTPIDPFDMPEEVKVHESVESYACKVWEPSCEPEPDERNAQEGTLADYAAEQYAEKTNDDTGFQRLRDIYVRLDDGTLECYEVETDYSPSFFASKKEPT